MLAIAGGLSATAGKTVSIIHRDDPDHPQNIPLQADPNHLGAQQNPEIFPGDTIVVAKAGVVYIVGDVAKAGGFLVDNNEPLSTAQALSLAGGPNRTASLSKTRLIRKVDGGRQEYVLDIAKLLKGEQADLPLKDGDIIWVPSSQFKTFGYRGIEAAIAITTGLIIYNGAETRARGQTEARVLAAAAGGKGRPRGHGQIDRDGVPCLKILYLGQNSGTSKQRKDALVRLGHQVVHLDPYALLPWNRAISLWQWRTGSLGLAEVLRRRVLRSLGETGSDLPPLAWPALTSRLLISRGSTRAVSSARDWCAI